MILVILVWMVSAIAVLAAVVAALSRSERRVLLASGVEALCVSWFLFVFGYEYLALLTAVISLFVVLVGYLYVVVESDAQKKDQPWYARSAPAVLMVSGLGAFLVMASLQVLNEPSADGKQVAVLGSLFVRDNRLSLYVMALALLCVMVGGAAMSRKDHSS